MAVAEKIEVSSSNISKKTQFNGKKGDNYLMWKMKFEADMGMKGLLDAFQPEFANTLPTSEKAMFDLSDKTKKVTAQCCRDE